MFLINYYMKTEFDYTKEAENLKMVADNVNPIWRKEVVVPYPVLELCTKVCNTINRENKMKIKSNKA